MSSFITTIEVLLLRTEYAVEYPKLDEEFQQNDGKTKETTFKVQ